MGHAEVTDRLHRVTRRIEHFIADGEIAGAGLVVAMHGEQVAEWYGGQAAPDLPAGPNVLWPLASISKLYTVAAVMALVEQGEVSLSMPIRRVLPQFDGGGREAVTLRHLLTHTSGLIYESPDMEELLRAQTPLDEIVNESYDHPLMFPPGTEFGYSDFGIAVAARVACRVTGTGFPELVRTLVLEPGRLHDTFMPPPPDEYPRIAHVTSVPAEGTDGAMYNSPYARELAHPAFGTVATARDLLRFGLLFAPSGQHRILAEATLRTMITDQTGGGLTGRLVGVTLTAPQSWGYGFMLRGPGTDLGFGELASPASFGHPGATGCLLLVDPVDDLAVAFVSNQHAQHDFERFLFRNACVANGVVTALTRRPS